MAIFPEELILDWTTTLAREIIEFAKLCMPTGETHIHARMLTGMVKVFTFWDREKYMLGKPGDFLAVRCDDRHDIFVVERDIFYKSYEEIEEM